MIFERYGSKANRMAAAAVASVALAGAEVSPAFAGQSTHNLAATQSISEAKPLPIVEGSFNIPNGIVGVVKLRNARTEGTSLNFADIKKSVNNAVQFGQEGIVLPLSIKEGTGKIDIPVNIGLSSINHVHGFVIADSAEEVYRASRVNISAAQEMPGITVFDPNTGDMTSYLAPAGDNYKTEFGSRIDANYFNLQTQVCSNLLETQLTKEAQTNLLTDFKKHGHKNLRIADVQNELYFTTQTAACGSYALAAAAQYSGISYQGYLDMAKGVTFDSIKKANGLEVPYTTLPEKVYSQMPKGPSQLSA